MTDEFKKNHTKTNVYVPQRPTKTELSSQPISTPTIITSHPASSSPPHWPPPTRGYRRVQRFSTMFRYLLAILALLLIFSGLGFIIFISTREYGTTLRSLAATREQATEMVIASTNVSIQRTANALSTMQAGIESSATAAEQASNQATATIAQATTTAQDFTARYKNETGKQAAFKNDLTQITGPGGWDAGQASNTKNGCTYQSGHYHATEVDQGYLQPCIAQQTYFRDFLYQTTITMYKSGEGVAGLLFRVNQANTSYYFFSISSTSNYSLDLCSAQEGCHTLGEGQSASIQPASAQGTLLAVMAKADTYALYANGHNLMSITDGNLSSGKIGVAVLDTSTPIDAVFHSVRVWTS
jgi:hypothetical protein